MMETYPIFKFNAKATSREKIINILTEEWPLSGKEIFNRLAKSYSHNITYQGVHKLLLESVNENIIIKQNGKYLINTEWIGNNLQFFETLKNRYSTSSKQKINPKFEGVITLEFESFTKLTLWLSELFTSKILVSDGDYKLVAYMRYGYWPLTFNFKDFLLLLKMLGNSSKGYPILKNKTPFGEWIMKQYMKAGAVNGIFDKKLEFDHDVFLNGDCIIEVYTTPEFDEFMKQTYGKIHNLNDLYQSFTKNSEPQTKLKVIITKNPQMARFLKKEAINKYFGEKDDK